MAKYLSPRRTHRTELVVAGLSPGLYTYQLQADLCDGAQEVWGKQKLFKIKGGPVSHDMT